MFGYFHRARDLGESIFSALTPDKSGEFDRSMQHHLKGLLFKDGVYDPEETIEAFSHARN